MKKKTNPIQTYSGIWFYPLEPDKDLVLLPDIAHALSNQCRFAGHVREFHSVGQHAVEVAERLKFESPMLQLAGLMHDSPEAYMVDLPRPLKLLMPEYVMAEKRLMAVIADRFSIPIHLFESVKEADHEALSIEAMTLMAPLGAGFDVTSKDVENVSGLVIEECWPPKVAERKFLEKFQELWNAVRQST